MQHVMTVEEKQPDATDAGLDPVSLAERQLEHARKTVKGSGYDKEARADILSFSELGTRPE